MNPLIRIMISICLVGISSFCYCQKLQSDTYLIIKIDSTNNHYLIRATRNNSINDSVLIISKKGDAINYCKCSLKILVGNRYDFIVDNFLEKEFTGKLPASANGFSMRLDNHIIKLNEKYFPFKTKNLSGLRYCID